MISRTPSEGARLRHASLGAAVIAVWPFEQQSMVFFISIALGFGFGSAVVSFNRLPTLLTAISRRFFLVPTAAYFDDIPTVDLVMAQGSGQSMVRRSLALIGAAPSPDKGAPMAQYRVFLGTHARLAGAVLRKVITFEPKEATRRAAVSVMQIMLKLKSCAAGAASKLR